jgi:hypothetical protein
VRADKRQGRTRDGTVTVERRGTTRVSSGPGSAPGVTDAAVPGVNRALGRGRGRRACCPPAARAAG